MKFHWSKSENKNLRQSISWCCVVVVDDRLTTKLSTSNTNNKYYFEPKQILLTSSASRNAKKQYFLPNFIYSFHFLCFSSLFSHRTNERFTTKFVDCEARHFVSNASVVPLCVWKNYRAASRRMECRFV